jgi:ACS family hexuronate transporter-like MFS transporter
VSFLVSAVGIVLVLRWLCGVTDTSQSEDQGTFQRRLGVLVVVAVMINITWHFFRAWLPLFLQKQHDYSEGFMNWFMLTYYVSTDVGTLTAGAVTLALVRRGLRIHGSRLIVFGSCALLCTLGVVVAFLPRGPFLLGVLLVIGFGALGLFPNYYSFSQELSARHQGKVTGALGCSSWLAVAPIHEAVGDLVRQTGSYSVGMAAAGCAPLLAVGALVLFWGRDSSLWSRQSC